MVLRRLAMTTKKLVLLIGLSLGFYTSIISTLLTRGNKSIQGERNLFHTQFIQNNRTNAHFTDIGRDVGLRVDNNDPKSTSTRVFLNIIKSSRVQVKYNTSLPPDCYSIIRTAETGNDLHSTINPTRSIAQSLMVNKLGAEVKRFPTTLIIGMRKAGTRALLTILRLHPQVKACGSEMHYFDMRYPRGLQWYLDQMPYVETGQQAIEKTPSYFVVKGVPIRILEYAKTINKTLRFLVIVRDPTVRAISDYVQLNLANRRKYNNVLKPFENMAIKNSNSTFAVRTTWGVIKTGVYSKHLQRWLKYFPMKSFHFVSGEQLVSNPYEEIKKVEEFLELKPYFSRSNFVHNNEKGFPCFRGSTNKKERCLGKNKGRLHPKIEPAVLNELRRYYRPFNEQLYKMVGRDFRWP